MSTRAPRFFLGLSLSVFAAGGCIPTAIHGGSRDEAPDDCQDCGDDGDGTGETEPGVAAIAEIDPSQLTLEVDEPGYLTMWLVDTAGDLVPTSRAPTLTSHDPLRLSVGIEGEISASEPGEYMVTGTLEDDQANSFEAVATIVVAAPEEGGGGGGDGGDGGGGCDKWQGDTLCNASHIGDKHCTGTSAADPGDHMQCDADGCGVKWTNIGPCPDGYFPE